MKQNSTGKLKRICKNGHTYYKSSDCPVCPVCEDQKRPTEGFLSKLSAPARRALENNGIRTLKQLSHFRVSEILKFHGMGKSSMPGLIAALEEEGLQFKKELIPVNQKAAKSSM